MRVVFIGKAGVGKTTIFSRFTGRKIHPRPSNVKRVTSDWQTLPVKEDEKVFYTTDTVGVEDAEELEEFYEIIKTADLVGIVIDVSDFTDADVKLLGKARKKGLNFFIIANKIDEAKEPPFDFYKFSPHVFFISALHKLGFKKLKDFLFSMAQKALPESKPVRVVVCGSPNAGKSTFLNAIFGKKRFRVSEIPGTTNEIVEEFLKTQKGVISFLDTAGFFRRFKRDDLKLYNFRFLRDALQKSDIAIFVVDASTPLKISDFKIANFIKNKPTILVFNKIDILDKREMQNLRKNASHLFGDLPDPEIFFVSALKNRGIKKVIDEIFKLKERKEMPLENLNRFVRRTIQETGLPLFLLNVKQIFDRDAGGPSILIRYRRKKGIFNFQKKKAFVRTLRQKYFLKGVPIKIKWQEARR